MYFDKDTKVFSGRTNDAKMYTNKKQRPAFFGGTLGENRSKAQFS